MSAVVNVSRRALQLALRRPLIDYCDSLPVTVRQAWESKRFQREAGTIAVSDKLVPATQRLDGHVAMRALLTLTGLYVIQWYGLPNTGLELGDTADELVALYPPGTSFTVSDGNAVQIGTNPAPSAGEVRSLGTADVVTITVPYQCVTQASLAA